jgi:hypothetical protein
VKAKEEEFCGEEDTHQEGDEEEDPEDHQVVQGKDPHQPPT